MPSNNQIESSTWDLAPVALEVIEEMKFENLNLSDLDQGQWMTLTFYTHKGSCTHLVDFIYKLW